MYIFIKYAIFNKSKKVSFYFGVGKRLEIIQEKLNNRPRKIIGYKTPKEMMVFELKYVA